MQRFPHTLAAQAEKPRSRENQNYPKISEGGTEREGWDAREKPLEEVLSELGLVAQRTDGRGAGAVAPDWGVSTPLLTTAGTQPPVCSPTCLPNPSLWCLQLLSTFQSPCSIQNQFRSALMTPSPGSFTTTLNCFQLGFHSLSCWLTFCPYMSNSRPYW